MLKVNIPGDTLLEIKNVVFDFNGTIAEDGQLIDGVKEKIKNVVENDVEVFILTSDTCGSVKKQCDNLPVTIKIFDKANAVIDKKTVIEQLGPQSTITIGNGKNDLLMFQISRVAIAVIGKEGCYTKTLLAADIVVTDIIDAIDLILHDNRIRATLRS